MPKTTFFLVAHGSPDPRPWPQLQALSDQVQQAIGQTVTYGVLESHPLTLSEQLLQAIETTQPEQLILVPLLLVPGRHAREDLPYHLAQVQAKYPQVRCHQTPTLSESPALTRVLAHQVLPSEPALFFAHGARHPAALQPLLALVATLGTLVCYQPDPEAFSQQLTQITQHHSTGVVVPLFLFEGGLVDKAHQEVAHHPGWRMVAPLGLGGQLLPVLEDLMGPYV